MDEMDSIGSVPRWCKTRAHGCKAATLVGGKEREKEAAKRWLEHVKAWALTGSTTIAADGVDGNLEQLVEDALALVHGQLPVRHCVEKSELGQGGRKRRNARGWNEGEKEGTVEEGMR